MILEERIHLILCNRLLPVKIVKLTLLVLDGFVDLDIVEQHDMLRLFIIEVVAEGHERSARVQHGLELLEIVRRVLLGQFDFDI